MPAWTYIMASQKNGTLYTGVTTDLVERVAQHVRGDGSKFAAKYGCHKLVWYEEFFDVSDAMKRLKEWRRAWKIELIEEANPGWDDLARYL